MGIEINESLGQNPTSPLKHAVGLSAVWQEWMSELYKSDCRLLTSKEHGQLGRIKKSIGMKQATELVEYAIRNWGKFAQKTAKDLGSNVVPPKPCVGWFYQYHAMALLMLHTELQAIAQQKTEKDRLAKQAEEEAQRIAARNAAYEAEKKQKPPTLERLKAIEAEVEAEFAAKHKLSA
jgi:hypothetical protein